MLPFPPSSHHSTKAVCSSVITLISMDWYYLEWQCSELFHELVIWQLHLTFEVVVPRDLIGPLIVVVVIVVIECEWQGFTKEAGSNDNDSKVQVSNPDRHTDYSD
jgi:hypothetical protein